MSGFVYFLRAGDDGPVKIGYTTLLIERMKVLHVGEAVSILRIIEGSFNSERWLHQYFSEIRRTGEWFEYHPEMLTIVPPAEELTDSRQRTLHTPRAAEEAKEIIRDAMWPYEIGDKISVLVRRAADRLGIKYGRARSMWYGIARLITADEMDHLRRAREVIRVERSLTDAANPETAR